ncbi:hypothetical protein OG394_17960 [Kribbella sp. NBC_01245]|uniref:hypothetical protein n=1 Tax=Kribbella sp. NBC_01245 TaxID=2903578 RepID=UPI002E2CE82B|nr:hypothetical protein [Kribbella sp. NBC_01245]
MRRSAFLGAVLLALVSPVSAFAAPGPQGQEVTVSKSSGLDPAGETVTITGRGFDLSKGIYVVFCVNKGAGQMPSPCLGGVDQSGASGSSAWISSNPPSYGEGLAKPFTQEGGKGSFSVQLKIKSKDQFTDCLNKKVAPNGCVIGTRADHTRTADRSADVLIPVTFAGSSSPSTTPSAGPTTTAPTTGPGVGKKDGSLASTGGTALGAVIVALVLLAGGAGLVVASRRRKTDTKETSA